MEMLEKFNLSGRVMQPAPQGGYQQPPASYGQPSAAPAPPDPNDYPTWGQLQQFVQQQAQQQLSPTFQGIHESMAAQSLQMLRTQDVNRKVFDKWGPEINALIAQVPPQARTLDNLQLLVDTVRGRHVDELVREGVTQLNTTPPTMRPNGFAGSSGAPPQDNGQTLASETIPQAWKERALNAGITDQVIHEWCQVNNQTPQQFYDMLAKSRVVTDSTRVAERRNEDGRVIGRETHFGG
jgi:hypothetical protein